MSVHLFFFFFWWLVDYCFHTGCNPEDLPKAMNDRETWRERGSRISVLAARHDDDDDCFKDFYKITCSIFG